MSLLEAVSTLTLATSDDRTAPDDAFRCGVHPRQALRIVRAGIFFEFVPKAFKAVGTHKLRRTKVHISIRPGHLWCPGEHSGATKILSLANHREQHIERDYCVSSTSEGTVFPLT